MTSRLYAKLRVRATNSATRSVSKSGVNPGIRGFIVALLLSLAALEAHSQQTHVLLNDERALVTRVELGEGETYVLTKDQEGEVWAAIDPVALVATKGGTQTRKLVRAGAAAILGSGEELQFRGRSNRHARLVIVKPKMQQQPLTVDSFVLDSLEDASDRNATLFVAISDCRFRDTRDLGDENKSILGKPQVVVMESGSVRWIRPGIHYFKTLGPKVAKVVSIEW
jgi:hypothetical protein